ncbi:hypothetical protein SDC9_209922 [bioreactor metagenome]|uniref:Uncharacterized protein n=1 Tax=bioreactor metagenome TaxID=1076179 RepID=A0A645JER4_9ZZZZ
MSSAKRDIFMEDDGIAFNSHDLSRQIAGIDQQSRAVTLFIGDVEHCLSHRG